MLSPAIIVSAVGCAELNSEHPIASAIVKYVREAIGSELTGTSSNFQAVPGCGLRCTVASLASMVNSAKNQPEFGMFLTQLGAGSSGMFSLNGVPVEVTNSQSLRLGELIGVNGPTLDDGHGNYNVIVGNREWMNRNGMTIREDIDRRMVAEEEQGRSAVLCAINGKILLII